MEPLATRSPAVAQRRLRILGAAAPVLVDWDQAAERAMEEWRAKLEALLRRGIAAGEFRADLDPRATSEVLRAMQVGMMQHLLDDKPYLDVSGEHHLRAATELFVAGLRAPHGETR